MEMVGQTIDARSPFSRWIVVYVISAILFIIWAIFVESTHPLFAAALPLGIALGLALGRPQRAVLLVDKDGLQPFGRPEKLYFHEISAVTVGGREYGACRQSLPTEPLEIHHDRGTLVLPPLMNVDFAAFHNFLLLQVPDQSPRTVPTVLADYLARQIDKFGSEKVQVVHTRRAFTERWRRRRRKWLSAGIFFAAAIWTVGGLAMMTSNPRADSYAGWFALGFFMGFAALVSYFAPHSLRQNPANRLLVKYPNSCLVVDPTGIALVQGDTKGALPWHEITKVTTKFSQLARTRQAKGVQLRVRGAEIIVFDIYERTPDEIEQLFRRNLDVPIV